jgi:DNA-binding GntR family transcriptional regulator
MLVQKKTISTQVADAIRQRILSGHYAANLQLRQELIATEFGVSRIPVREALHQLHSEGFVTLVSHKGAIVTPVSLEEILELYELRARIETWLLALAIPRMTEEHLASAQLEADRFGAQSADAEYSYELNWAFHNALYVASGRKTTIEMVGRIHQQIERYTRMMVSLTGNQLQSDLEHHQLIELCRARDPMRASQLLEVHIMDGGRFLVESLTALRNAQSSDDRVDSAVA